MSIRARDGEKMLAAHVMGTAKLERLAQEWGYILRERSRWSADTNLRDDFSTRAIEDLEHVGLPRDFLQRWLRSAALRWNPKNPIPH